MIQPCFFSRAPVVLKAPEIQRMPDFAQEGTPCHLPVQVSPAQQGEPKNVLYAAALIM